jgi:TPR repeat protein
LRYLKRAASQKHARANFELGQWFIDQNDLDNGLKYFQQAIHLGHVKAILSHVYVTRKRGGAERSLSTEFEMLVRASELASKKDRYKDLREEIKQLVTGPEYAEFQYALGKRFLKYAKDKMKRYAEGRIGRGMQVYLQAGLTGEVKDELLDQANKWLEAAKKHNFKPAIRALAKLAEKAKSHESK